MIGVRQDKVRRILQIRQRKLSYLLLCCFFLLPKAFGILFIGSIFAIQPVF